MPKFQSLEKRQRGFNGNRIVIGDSETVEITQADVDVLKKDPSFVDVIKSGLLRDLDGVCSDLTGNLVPARMASKPSTDLDVALSQINAATSPEQIAIMLQQMPPLDAEGQDAVKKAVMKRQEALARQAQAQQTAADEDAGKAHKRR